MTELPLEEILRALRGLRVPAFPSEHELHQMIAAALEDGDFCVRHEVLLKPRCRIDFVVNRVGLEVKKGGPARARITEQARRYLDCDALGALILVVGRNVSMPSNLLGKPVRVLSLNSLWGVALP